MPTKAPKRGINASQITLVVQAVAVQAGADGEFNIVRYADGSVPDSGIAS